MNLNIKTRIKINGKEYSSADEMPDDIRRLYEQVMQGNVQKTTKIKFNGQEYAGVEEMQPEVRKMYEAVMGVVETHPQPDGITPEQSRQIADAISGGKKLEAVKLYRSATGNDLKGVHRKAGRLTP